MGGSSLLGCRVRSSTFCRSTIVAKPSKRSTLAVRSVLEMNKPKVSDGSASSGIDAAAAAEDVKRELHYRLAANSTDNESLYKSVAWSVHNRLLDSFEKTHEFWK